jgi:hypothetical protein
VDINDASKAGSCAGEASIFGVPVRLTAAAPGAGTAAEATECPEYQEVRREYATIASRVTAFYSRASVPAEWGYTDEFVASVLGSITSDGQAATELLMVACGGGCPLAQLPPETALAGACSAHKCAVARCESARTTSDSAMC